MHDASVVSGRTLQVSNDGDVASSERRFEQRASGRDRERLILFDWNETRHRSTGVILWRLRVVTTNTSRGIMVYYSCYSRSLLK